MPEMGMLERAWCRSPVWRALAQRVVLPWALQGTRLPFPDGRFDAVLSFIMLHHVVEWEDALSEAARVLRPGGRFVGYDLAASAPARWMHQVRRQGQRMTTAAEMRDQLDQLPFDDHTVAPAVGAMVMRFRATRSVH